MFTFYLIQPFTFWNAADDEDSTTNFGEFFGLFCLLPLKLGPLQENIDIEKRFSYISRAKQRQKYDECDRAGEYNIMVYGSALPYDRLSLKCISMFDKI